MSNRSGASLFEYVLLVVVVVLVGILGAQVLGIDIASRYCQLGQMIRGLNPENPGIILDLEKYHDFRYDPKKGCIEEVVCQEGWWC